MDSAYIQHASTDPNPDAQHQVKFTNLSNQQQYPGQLYQFHAAQTAATQPMPFTNDDIQTPPQGAYLATLSESRNNVSQMARAGTRDIFFRENVKSTHTEFRTPSQRAWNVPFNQTEARATDMF